MLKKLFVHEWKDCYKSVAFVNALVILLTIVGVFIFPHLDKWGDGPMWLALAFSLYLFLYVIAIIVMVVFVWIYFWLRFYKNLYTDQGYLMHTLPVTQDELILSKLFVALICTIISCLVAFLSVFLLSISAYGADISLKEALEAMHLPTDGKAILFMIIGLFVLLAHLVLSYVMGYASVSIGQQLKKTKLGGAVGIYIGFSMMYRFAVSVVMAVLNYGSSLSKAVYENTFEGTTNNVLPLMLKYEIAGLVLVCAAVAIFYVITRSTMKNKLNLE